MSPPLYERNPICGEDTGPLRRIEIDAGHGGAVLGREAIKRRRRIVDERERRRQHFADGGTLLDQKLLEKKARFVLQNGRQRRREIGKTAGVFDHRTEARNLQELLVERLDGAVDERVRRHARRPTGHAVGCIQLAGIGRRQKLVGRHRVPERVRQARRRLVTR